MGKCTSTITETPFVIHLTHKFNPYNTDTENPFLHEYQDSHGICTTYSTSTVTEDHFYGYRDPTVLALYKNLTWPQNLLNLTNLTYLNWMSWPSTLALLGPFKAFLESHQISSKILVRSLNLTSANNIFRTPK